MAAKLLHGKVSLLLREVAVQCLSVISVVYELIGHFLRFLLGAAEHDSVYLVIIVNDTFQGQLLVLGVHHIEDMINVFGTLIAASHNYFLIIMQIALGHSLYVFAHCGREEQCVAVLGHARQ